MEYQDYIELGFQRIDINDGVVFRETGYYGFILVKKITNKIGIELYWNELDKPTMYIKKQDDVIVHRIEITPEIVKDLLC